jgi:putative FmdB family regulatory protein
MPIYEYQCSACGSVEEALQKFSDKPLTKCRNCSGKLHKLISQSAFHLKGTGWYVTD